MRVCVCILCGGGEVNYGNSPRFETNIKPTTARTLVIVDISTYRRVFESRREPVTENNYLFQRSTFNENVRYSIRH